MTETEFVDYIRPLVKKDPALAHALDSEYTADPKASIEQLKARAEYSLGRVTGLIAMADGKNVSSLPEAFGSSEAMLRRIIDPNSNENWTRLPLKTIKDAAVKAGYMKDLPNNATDAQKAENREGLSTFLNLLSAETIAQGRRNAVNEYENVKFSKHPYDWARKTINDLLFRTTANRMKEQALRGQGPSGNGLSGFAQMGLNDAGALLGDIGVNAMYGAGAAGVGRALASRAPMGIRSARDILLGPAIAGSVAGTMDAVNRGINTENGTRWYEYPSEAVLGALSNVVAEPRVIRGAIRGASSMLKGAKVGGHNGREFIGKGQKVADRLTGQTEAQLREVIEDLKTPNPSTSPMSSDTRKKIDEMGEILDDGMTPAPGEEASLFEQAQALFEKGAYDIDGTPRSVKLRDASFTGNIDNKIDELEGVLKHSAGAEEAPQVKRQLDYWKNLKEMRANGLLDYDKYFFEKNPEPFQFVSNPIEGAPTFEVRNVGSESDRRDIANILYMWRNGSPIEEIKTLAIEPERYSDLLARYPELSNYLASQRKISEPRASGLGETFEVKYDKDFVPDLEKWKANFKDRKVAGKTWTEALLMGAVKPAATGTVLEKYDRPEASEDVITRDFEQLMARKPDATSAALNWKFDPRLDAKLQLDEFERGIVNKYRAMLTEKALSGR